LALFLLLSRPYEDEVFQTYEIITTLGQLAMMIVVLLGYFQVYPPQGTFIGIVAFILIGQIGKQACCCHASNRASIACHPAVCALQASWRTDGQREWWMHAVGWTGMCRQTS
jgi:hypothetical protein